MKPTPTISFNTTSAEIGLITDIVNRAFKDYPAALGRYDRLDLHMDLTATHANGCPLDFDRLLHFDDFDFSHDIFGIIQHLNRNTGQLGGRFLPRCAKKEA